MMSAARSHSSVVGAALLSSCTWLVDTDGYRDRRDGVPSATLDGGMLTVSRLLSYRFERAAEPFRVDAAQGLPRSDPDGTARLEGSLATDRGGSVDVAADGGFVYTPPGAPGAFWGDDAFSYAQDAESSAVTRVKLTVDPDRIELGQLSAEVGTGYSALGPSINTLLGEFSRQVAPLGDVNGDGFEDWAAAAPGNPNLSVYVIFGGPRAGQLELDELDTSAARGFRIKAERMEDFFARGSIGGAGDVNGDGLDDIVIGAMLGALGAGAAYVVFGKADNALVTVSEIEAGGGGGFAVVGSEIGSFQGLSVAGAGDVNGDGLDDVVVAGLGDDVGELLDAGAAFVILGKPGTEPVQLAEIEAGRGGGYAVLGDTQLGNLGSDVRAAGDVNGDGLDDIVLGAWFDGFGEAAVAREGRAYVVFGKRDVAPVSVADLAGRSAHGFQMLGPHALDKLGATVSGAGDVNGDGFDDVVVAAPCGLPAAGAAGADLTYCATNLQADAPPGSGQLAPAGLSYVVFGGREPGEVRLVELESGSDARGFVIVGATPDDQLGVSLSAGELDGDGLSDMLIGTANRTWEGKAYAVFGKSDTAPVTIAALEAGDPGGIVIASGTNDAAGVASTTGADIDGNGVDDLIVAALFHPGAPPLAGGAYVAYGWDMTGALAARDGVYYGGPEADTFELSLLPPVRARGGHGADTLRVSEVSDELNLALDFARYESIELIDVRGGGPCTVVLNDAAVRRLPQNHSGFTFSLARTLSVLGDADDTVRVDLTEYSRISARDGRTVYARNGAYYGLELSTAMRIEPAAP